MKNKKRIETTIDEVALKVIIEFWEERINERFPILDKPAGWRWWYAAEMPGGEQLSGQINGPYATKNEAIIASAMDWQIRNDHVDQTVQS